jgi:hypothetical protein
MAIPSLIKQPTEDRLYGMDFAALLSSGESLAGITSVVATPTGLTLSGSPSIAGTFAQQRILGGTAGIKYTVTFIVTTTQSNTLEGEGILQVKDI